MSKPILKSCLFLFLLFLFCCKGPEGDPGPKGDTGAAGTKGDTGAVGPQGEAGKSDTTAKARVYRVSLGSLQDGFYSLHLTKLSKTDYDFFSNSTVQVYFKTFGYWLPTPGGINFWEANADVIYSWFLSPTYNTNSDFEVGVFASVTDESLTRTLSFDEMRIVVTPGTMFNMRERYISYDELAKQLNIDESKIINLK